VLLGLRARLRKKLLSRLEGSARIRRRHQKKPPLTGLKSGGDKNGIGEQTDYKGAEQ